MSLLDRVRTLLGEAGNSAERFTVTSRPTSLDRVRDLESQLKRRGEKK